MTNMAAEKHASGAWAPVFAPRAAGEVRYWLVKFEPDTFSFYAVQKAPKKTTPWDGVRNFVARNFLRDGMKRGDQVFFYHSSVKPQAIVGIAQVAREAYPDPTALDKKHPAFDAKSDPKDPSWYAVDLEAVAPLAKPVTLTEIKANKALAEMALVRIGRLSVTPVRPAEWDAIVAMSKR